MRYELNLVIRIILALFIGFFREIFYAVFGPLTLFYSWFMLTMFKPAVLIGNMIITSSMTGLEFVEACTAGSAYLLLTLLILLTKDITWRTRVQMFLYGSITFLSLNLLRIGFLFIILFTFSLNVFDIVHIFLWRVVSTLFVFGIWVWLIRKFKVDSVPIISDINYLVKNILKKK